MGYKLERYSRAELNKLSSPGSVIPALFWVIPLGNWNHADLDDLWYYFTQRKSNLKTLGLLLAKDIFWENGENKANLSAITGKLEDLMPEGINSIYDENYLNQDDSKANKFLILSGNYPQPGWGLFVCANEYISFLEDLDCFLSKYSNIKDKFEETHKDYLKWNEKKLDNPKIEDINILNKRLSTLNKILPICNGLNLDLINKNYNLFHYEILKKFCDENPNDDITKNLIQIKEIFDSKLVFSIMVMRSIEKENITKKELNKLIDSFLNEFDKEKNNLFKLEEIKKSYCKRVIGSFVLNHKENLYITEDVASYYEDYHYLNIDEAKNKFSEILKMMNSIYGEIKFSIDNIENINNEKLIFWQYEKEELRKIFQNSLEYILDYYNKNSFKFLFNLEYYLSKKDNYSVKSLSWDPPRMIGWKLWALDLKIEEYDIQHYLTERIHDITKHLNDTSVGVLIDGNSFTDYIHYYSINKTNLTPRIACKEILARVLRASDIRKVLNYLNIIDNLTDEIELILINFGWPYVENNKMPLRNCIEIKGDKLILNESLNGNQIRTVLENFCKDLIDVLILKINYNVDDIQNFILYEINNKVLRENYERAKSWQKFISQIQLKVAIDLISHLLKKAFPTIKHKLLLENLDEIRKKTNPSSHDNPDFRLETLKIAISIQSILEKTHNLISEMPWHFKPIQRNGNLPIVLTGNAWSHSFPSERQISLILWESNVSNGEFLVWNYDKKNPVMPNAKIIRRPT